MQSWLGYLVREIVVSNLNLALEDLVLTCYEYPRAFVRNPALAFYFIEDPRWLSTLYAEYMMIQLTGLSDFAELEAGFPERIACIRRCAEAPPHG